MRAARSPSLLQRSLLRGSSLLPELRAKPGRAVCSLPYIIDCAGYNIQCCESIWGVAPPNQDPGTLKAAWHGGQPSAWPALASLRFALAVGRH